MRAIGSFWDIIKPVTSVTDVVKSIVEDQLMHIVYLELTNFKSPVRYFNSLSELDAQLDKDKKAKYFDPKKMNVIPGIKLAQSQMNELEALNDIDKIVSYFKKYTFNAWVTINGQDRWFRYDPRKMNMAFIPVKGKQKFEEAQKQQELQQQYDALCIKAREVFLKLSAIGKKKMSDAEYSQYVDFVAAYNDTVYKIQQLPGVKVQVQKYTVDTAPVLVNGKVVIPKNKVSGIGIAPLLIIAIVLIVAGGVVITVDLITKNINKSKAYKANLEAQSKNLDEIIKAGILKKQGQLSDDTYNTIVKNATDSMKTNNDNLLSITKSDTSGGIFSNNKEIVMIAAGALILTKIIK